MNSRKRTQRIISAALTSLFMLHQTMMISAFATNITAVNGVNGVYNIDPTAVIKNTDIGYRKYMDFDLSKGDIANLNFSKGIKDINTFVNLVDNKINIEGTVNSMRDNHFYNGRAIFVSPKGMVVGSSGVLNVGSLGVYTPTNDVYKYYVNNPNATLGDLSHLQNSGDGTVTINGKVLAAQDIDIVSSNINVPGKMVASGTGVVNEFNNTLFNQLVNTNNVKTAKNYSRNGGKITFTSSAGTDVSGSVVNHGTGAISMKNINSNGINISGNVASNGDVILNNTGNNGVLIASSGKVDANNDIYMNDTSRAGISHQGLSRADNNVDIKANGGNIVIGDNSSKDNYVTAGNNIDINVNNGSILNSGVEKVLLNAGGNLTMNTTDGTIGLPVQQAACIGSGCTGIGPKNEGSRDFTKSVNANIKGDVNATTTKSSKPDDLVINYAAIDSDMNIDKIKADGRVILTVDDDYGYSNNGANRYNMVNARTNNSNTNIEGTGISLISNGSIGTENKPVTFIQTGADDGFGMDVLAQNNINLKENSFDDSNYGRNKEIKTNKVCTIIARKGDANLEFGGNTTIDNITAEGDLNVTTRGKNLDIKNLGHITDNSVIPNDYLGSRTYGQQDGGYTKPDYRDEALPNHATVKALDINHNIRPTDEYVDNGHEAWAGSTVKIANAVLDNGTLDITADNIYANGIEEHINKNGFSKVTNPITNKIEGSNSIPTGHAVRPDDVKNIGRNEKERNYYYPQGDGDGIFNGIESNVDDNDGIVDATPLQMPDEKQPDNPSVDPATDAPSDPATDVPTDSPIDYPSDVPTDSPTDVPSDTPSDMPSDLPTETPSDEPSYTPTDIPTDMPTDAPSDEPTYIPTDTPSDTPSDMPYDNPTDAPSDEPSDHPSYNPTDVPTDAPTDAPTPNPSVNPEPSVTPEPTDPATDVPSDIPTDTPSDIPSDNPTDAPSDIPSDMPSDNPTDAPSDAPTVEPTDIPTSAPTDAPSDEPTEIVTDAPTDFPSDDPNTEIPTDLPTDVPTDVPSDNPSDEPSNLPTDIPTDEPTDGPTTNPSVPPQPSIQPSTQPSLGPDIANEENTDGRIMYNQRIDDDVIDSIDKRQYMRYRVSDTVNPVAIEKMNGVESLIDVSRGGVSVTHNNELKVGDIVPVHIAYGALDIKANVKVVSATTHRAGAKFVNLDQATANQLLYLNMVLDEVNRVSLR